MTTQLSLDQQLLIQKNTYLFEKAINNILEHRPRPTVNDFGEVIELFQEALTQNAIQQKLAKDLFKDQFLLNPKG